jgi:hypothetical protein
MRYWFLAAALVASPAAAVAQHTEHDSAHARQAVHSHRGAGPHYVDALFTENAYLERKLRPDLLAAATAGGEAYTARLELEWAFARQASVVIHLPFHHVVSAGLSHETGPGDIRAGPKVALIQRRTVIIAGGADFTAPTGSAARGLGEGHWSAAPFVLAWVPFGPDRAWLLQAAGHLDVPLERGHETHAEVSGALSWTSSGGFTPIVEGIVEAPLEGAQAASVFVAPGFRWEFTRAWEVGAASRVRVRGPSEDDLTVIIGFVWHFPLER